MIMFAVASYFNALQSILFCIYWWPTL